MFDEIRRNKRRTFVLIGALTLLTSSFFAALLYFCGLRWAGVVIGFVISLILALVAYGISSWLALSLGHAEPARPDEYARLHNLVEGLCIAGALPKPRLYVIQDAAPNAFASGRNPGSAAVAVTTGLLEKMNRVELEAVLAHELSHVRNYDILVATVAVTMAGALQFVHNLFSYGSSGRSDSSSGAEGFSPSSDRDRGGDGDGEWISGLILLIVGIALIVLAPFLAQLLKFAISRNRESLADFSAAELTRYPPGLISALEKLRDDPTPARASSGAIAHLWFESPTPTTADKPSRLAKYHRTHPPLDERIAALRRL
jgi:heat shock protein HtpX